MVPPVERAPADVLCRRGSRGWLVGGSVRDRLLGRFSPDVDVVVDDDPEAVAQEVAAVLGASWFSLSARHGSYRVVTPAGHIDVSSMQGDNIVADLGRRDFTINAMAEPLLGGGLIDPFGGRDHLVERVLVEVSASVFRDDPLRLLRAARFSHVLGFRMKESLEALIHDEARLLERAAGERVAGELVLTLSAGRTSKALSLWQRVGLLAVLFPKLVSSHTHDSKALAGSWAASEQLDKMLAGERSLFPPHVDAALRVRLDEYIDGVFSRPVGLRLALVLRSVSSQEAVAIARRLRLSAAMSSLLQASASCFSSDAGAHQRVDDALSSPRATISFLWHLAPWEPELLLLMAATYAAEARLGGDGEARLQSVQALGGTWARRARGDARTMPVTGDTLMDVLGLQPGPLLGATLEEVRLAWEAGEENTVEGLLAAARRWLAYRRDPGSRA